ncbi:hypothetical protein HU200_028345 [Digitaria exilis]|uniref:Uncharacterized protein n=1 Tax=Digitaria exilis TaxID=1010633 RepID=A0A835C5D2_9POAL|nr:hypothetical protein HU200_028345 [Digitaria exilis]
MAGGGGGLLQLWKEWGIGPFELRPAVTDRAALWFAYCLQTPRRSTRWVPLQRRHGGDSVLSVSIRRDGAGLYNRADVVISYVLLAGALVLETTLAPVLVLGYGGKPFKPASRRLWRGSMGQYNLIHLATRDRTDLVEDWWNKLHFSGTFSGTDSLPMSQFKELLEKTVQRERFATQAVVPLSSCYRRGQFVLNSRQALKGVAGWTVQNPEFDETVVIWHVATDIFISEITAAAGHSYDAKLVEATTVLSNYMMYLLVAKPNMLPGRPDCSSGISDQVDKKKLAESLCRTWTIEMVASILGMDDTLELIFAVWVEIMLYAAERVPRDSHARELGNGGEFITILPPWRFPLW